MNRSFPASLDTASKCIGYVLMPILCIGAAALTFGLLKLTQRSSGFGGWLLFATLLILLCVTVFFYLRRIKGYQITDDELVIDRAFGTSTLNLADFSSAVPQAGIRGAWRVFGNGGVFGWSGHFYASKIGHFYAQATRMKSAGVLLHRPHTKPLFISPDDPAGFVEAITPQLTSANTAT